MIKENIQLSCIILLLCLFIVGIEGIMIKKECPIDEMYKSCKFVQEYTCWHTDARLERVKAAPKRYLHCISGCFCKKGLVRAYPEGNCIVAAVCRNKKTEAMLSNLPINQ